MTLRSYWNSSNPTLEANGFRFQRSVLNLFEAAFGAMGKFTRPCALIARTISSHVNKLSFLEVFWRPQIIVITAYTLSTVRKQQKCDVKCGNYRFLFESAWFPSNLHSTLIWFFRRHEQTLPYYPNSSNSQIKCEMLLQSIKIPLCCSFRNRFVSRHSSTRSVFCGN